MIEIIILFCLILINGLLVMSEIALISAKKSRLEGRASKGDKRAKVALFLQEKPEIFLSTAQIFITLISILTGVYSGEKFSDYLKPSIEKITLLRPYAGTIATVLIVIIVTFLSIIIGELIPKRIGMLRPEKIARIVSGPMRILSRISFPVVWLLTTITNFILFIFNIKESKDNQVTEDEIKAIISEGTEHGAIEEDEKEIIERVFQLGDRNITSLMTHRTDIMWLDINEDKEAFRQKIHEHLHSVYPICDKDIDNILGIIYIKNLYLNPDASLGDLMQKALVVPENNSAYQLLEKFKQTKIHHAFIVDEYGTLQGMITLNDVLGAIVGDIPNLEDSEYEIVKRKDGTYLVDAQLPFYDFLIWFNKPEWANEDEHDFDTIAGFILHELKRIPQTSDTFTWRGFEFEIMDMDNHRIDKVLVKISEEILEKMESD